VADDTSKFIANAPATSKALKLDAGSSVQLAHMDIYNLKTSELNAVGPFGMDGKLTPDEYLVDAAQLEAHNQYEAEDAKAESDAEIREVMGKISARTTQLLADPAFIALTKTEFAALEKRNPDKVKGDGSININEAAAEKIESLKKLHPEEMEALAKKPDTRRPSRSPTKPRIHAFPALQGLKNARA